MTTQSRYVEGPVPSRSAEKISPMVQLEKNLSTIVKFSIGGYSHSEKTVTIHLNDQMWLRQSDPSRGIGPMYQNNIYSFTIDLADVEEKLRNVKTRVIGESEDSGRGNKYYITINNYKGSQTVVDKFKQEQYSELHPTSNMERYFRRHFNNLFASAMNNLEGKRDFYVDVLRLTAFKDEIWPDFQMKQSKNSSLFTSIELSESFARQLVEFFNQD